MTAPLPLGKVVATPGALKLLSEIGEDPFGYITRHATGDWESSVPSTAARTRWHCVTPTGSLAPTQ
jgi:hypothetical protein